MEINGKAVLYGVFAGIGILAFYLAVLAIFQGYGFAIYEFKSLWYWIVPLAVGFGTQIGLYTSIAHNSTLKAGVATSGAISGGSMVACCTHFLLNLVPIIGLSGLSLFLMEYQTAFFAIGIASNIAGITLMLNHKMKMKRGSC